MSLARIEALFGAKPEKTLTMETARPCLIPRSDP
jgi:hypothetical protein